MTPAPVQPLSGPSRSNPNLYRPPPPAKSPKSDGRRVAFRETVEDIDAYNASPRVSPKDGPAAGATGVSTSSTAMATGKSSKWQPLSPVDPNPIAENDPFSLGDSDDEREAVVSRDGSKGSSSGIRLEDVESAEQQRLRQATADAMAESLVDDKVKKST